MKMIVSVDKNWGIGRENRLLLRISEDLKRFKEKTTGNIIVMGRKTLESFPGGNPLKDRINIVLSKNKAYKKEGAIVLGSVSEVLEKVKEFPEKEVFIVGGGKIYTEFLPFCTEALITKIDFAFDADTFIESLDENSDWQLLSKSRQFFEGEIPFCYLDYVKKNKSCCNL